MGGDRAGVPKEKISIARGVLKSLPLLFFVFLISLEDGCRYNEVMNARYMILGVLALGIGFGASSCQSTSSVPETRPVGESVLTAAQLREAETALSFSRHVQPILEERCLHCHDGKEMPGKFSFATREEAFQGGRIVPGDAEGSLVIVSLTTGNHAMSMPAVGTAPAPEEVEVLKRWIDAGADWPAGVRLRPKN
jgi:hypothetical protein